MSRSRRATSADVARRAGVSRATVSYVLNGRADQAIPEATRQRVLDAARELNYTPNVAARALRAGESRLVLLVNEGIPLGTNLAKLVDALAAQVAQGGRSLVLWQRLGPGGLASALTHLEPCLTITLGELGDDETELLEHARIPVVDAGLGGDLDPAEGAIPAVLQIQHLVDRGHRRIGVLSTDNPVLARFAGPRVAGARTACEALGLAPPRIAELPTGERLTVEKVTAVLAGWREGPDPVTAVACYNDYFAAACLAAAARSGLSVPAHLAVVGIDDELFARYTQPPLTTVRLDTDSFAEDIWSRALHALDEALGSAAHRPPRYTLVDRGSA